MAYRPADASAMITQISLYDAYRSRFDPYFMNTPLMGGQELIQLVLATFPGCEMARNEGEYVLRGVDQRDWEPETGDTGEGDAGGDGRKNALDGLAEPVRASTW